jgi:hypothetical protein
MSTYRSLLGAIALGAVALAARHRQVKVFQMYIIKPLVRNLPDNLRLWQTSSGGEFNVRFVNLTMPFFHTLVRLGPPSRPRPAR